MTRWNSRADDLALDAAGAEQIFAQAHVSLTPELAAAVTERTEGWPVGLLPRRDDRPATATARR